MVADNTEPWELEEDPDEEAWVEAEQRFAAWAKKYGGDVKDDAD